MRDPVGQRSLATQRHGRFVAGSGAHPARMALDLAAHLIADYTRPGDLVFDSLAGIGTTLVEAIHAGRDAVGVELELGLATLAKAKLALARHQAVARSEGRAGRGWIVHGDATRLPRGVPAGLRGRVALVLTSPPYGRTMHGRVDHRHGLIRCFSTPTASTATRPTSATACAPGSPRASPPSWPAACRC